MKPRWVLALVVALGYSPDHPWSGLAAGALCLICWAVFARALGAGRRRR